MGGSLEQFCGDYLTENIRGVVLSAAGDINEIRLRVNRPLSLTINGKEKLKSESIVTAEDIKKIMELMTDYSVYAFEDDIRNGYITLKGGHRVGVSGQAAVEDGRVKALKNINGLNIRIAHEIIGCADSIMEFIARPTLKNTLVISPPGCGKTTLVRDIARQLSNGTSFAKGKNVAICDERSELAGSYMGVPQNDIGQRTDVLDGAPKSHGMLAMVRSISPHVVVADEIGRKEDVTAICEIINSGVKLLCSVHGTDIEDVSRKPFLSELIKMKLFELFIVLKHAGKPGVITGVYDADGNGLMK